MDTQRSHRLRYSLKSLFAVVTLVAVGLAGLKNPGPWWAVGFVHLTFLLLLLAVLLGVYRRAAFPGGFAIGGCAWLVLLAVFYQPGMRSPDSWPVGVLVDANGNPIGNTKGPYAMEENPMCPESVCRGLSSVFWGPPHMPDGEFRCFRVVAYCVATWLIGFFTGVAASFIRPADATSRRLPVA